MTPWQRLTVLNLYLIGVVLGKGLGKNCCSDCFYKTRVVINERFTY